MTRSQKIQNIFEGLMTLKKAMGPRKECFLHQHDLTGPQLHILYALAHVGNLTVKEVAGKMGITSSAATQIIEGLVKGGYVERNQDEQDRRIVHIEFSGRGKRKFENIKRAHMERVCMIFDVLTDEEIDLLIGISEKVLRHAHQIDEKKS